MRFRLFNRCRRFLRYWASNEWATSCWARATAKPIVDFLLLEQSIQELGWKNQENCRFQHCPAILANLQSRETAHAYLRWLWLDDFSEVRATFSFDFLTNWRIWLWFLPIFEKKFEKYFNSFFQWHWAKVGVSWKSSGRSTRGRNDQRASKWLYEH